MQRQAQFFATASQHFFRIFSQELACKRTLAKGSLRVLCCSLCGNRLLSRHAQEPIITSQFQLRSGAAPSRSSQSAHEPGSERKRPTPDAEDLRLVRELQDGNPDALTSLFEKHSAMVFNVARRILNNSSEAEEVVQQVFIDTYKVIQQFDPQKAAYKTWLYQFAYTRAINRKIYLDSKGFYVSEELNEQALMAELYEGAGRFVQQLSSQEAVYLVRQLLESVRPNQRKAIELTFFHGFTAEEIAARTGETPASVRHNLYRGLAKLRSALVGNGKQTASEGKTKTERILVADPARLL